MATQYIFPTSAQLRTIEQLKLPNLLEARPVFDEFPIVPVDDSVLMWEQEDNYTGLQQLRGINGAPPRINRIGAKRYVARPGVYGEFSLIDEDEITRRRAFGRLDQRIDLRDLTVKEQDRLIGRRLDRIELIIWTLLATGTFSVPTATNAIAHTDSYTTQTYTAGVTWATAATATPMANFRAVKLLARGYSVRFDAAARAYMNSSTANAFYGNLNPNDLFGRRDPGGSTLSRDAARGVLASDNLPQIIEYDQGYLDDTGTFQLFIPNNKVIVVGARMTGAAVGEFQMTRNANNPGAAAGPYQKVIDRGDDHVPRTVEVHDGFNGGPVLFFPSAIVVMTV